jgi:predicted GNAT superfamily acetyltransferase
VIEYRHLTELADFPPILDIQREVWGFDDVEVIPSRIFRVGSEIGGQVIGAYDGGRLIAFCFSIPGIRKPEGTVYLHSHMAAVLPDYRNQGIGRRLKLEQRADALRRGIQLIEWTFDPLEIKNAFLNIERLGVIVRRYVVNNYGVTTSKLHTGMPTDRCVAEWRLADPATEAVIDRRTRDHGPVAARISIPSDIDQIRRSHVGKALEIQRDVRQQFLDHFQQGLTVTGFERSEAAGTYLLSRTP